MAERHSDRHHGGVVVEARDQRDFVEVAAEFQVIVAGLKLDGVRLSRRHVVARAPADPATKRTWTMRDGERVPLLVRIGLSGFVLEIAAYGVRRFALTQAGGHFRFDLQGMDRRNEAALAQVVRTLLRGEYPTVEEFAGPADTETPIASPRKAERGFRGRALAIGGLAALFALGLAAYGALSVYAGFMTERSTIATLTAPRIDLFAATSGIVQANRSFSGLDVTRDQHLLSVFAPDLSADIQASEAKVGYYDALLGDGAAKANGLRDTIAPVGFDDLGLPQAAKPAMLRHARDFELGILQSLKTQSAALDVFAPCNCRVVWAADPRSTVKAGDLLVTLARTTPDDLRIEALFDLSEATAIHPGQRAKILDPATGDRITATVEQVLLDATDSPRIGVPEALRRDASHATVVLKAATPPTHLRIGAPLEVVILK
ncbi:MAG TPA: hypothetical protein VHA70_08010 [Bauldia sp.]|nr:hypothetical protein [Bauldia sp.]